MALKPNPGETPIVRFIGIPPSVAATQFPKMSRNQICSIDFGVFGVPSVPSLEVYHIHPTSQSALLHKSMMFFELLQVGYGLSPCRVSPMIHFGGNTFQ